MLMPIHVSRRAPEEPQEFVYLRLKYGGKIMAQERIVDDERELVPLKKSSNSIVCTSHAIGHSGSGKLFREIEVQPHRDPRFDRKPRTAL